MPLSKLLGRLRGRKRKKPTWPPPNDVGDEERRLIAKYQAYTGASPARLYALVNAVNHVDALSLPGDIVECGVFRGANPMMVKELRRGRTARRIHLFDTFAGMTAPSAADVRHDGRSAAAMMAEGGGTREGVLSACSIGDVKNNFAACGLDLEDLRFIEGPVEQTLRVAANLPETIAVLRLDTDWYESTKAELEVLYPRLAPGGVLIVDDYGCWQGSRQAVDEYFGAARPLLTAVDAECRVAVKPL